MLILAGDMSIPITLNELRSVLQRMNTILPFPNTGSDALHFNAKEETFSPMTGRMHSEYIYYHKMRNLLLLIVYV